MSKGKKQSPKKAAAFSLTKEMPTKNNLKNSVAESLKDLVVGAVGGGLAGAAIGKPSLIIGLGTSLIGHYMGSPLATNFGLGMMASGGYQIGSGAVSGTATPEGLEGAKERVKDFGANLKQRFYLDKILPPKAAAAKEESTNGMGNVQYFNYPSQTTEGVDKGIDMSALDNLEKEIAKSGEQFQQKQVSGTYDDMSGLDDEKLY